MHHCKKCRSRSIENSAARGTVAVDGLLSGRALLLGSGQHRIIADSTEDVHVKEQSSLLLLSQCLSVDALRDPSGSIRVGAVTTGVEGCGGSSRYMDVSSDT